MANKKKSKSAHFSAHLSAENQIGIDVAKPKGLVLRGDSYAERICVPKALIPSYGKAQIWEALGTKNLKDAIPLAYAVITKYETEFALKLAQLKNMTNAPDMLSGYSDEQLRMMANDWLWEMYKKHEQAATQSPTTLSEKEIEEENAIELQEALAEKNGTSLSPINKGIVHAAKYLQRKGISHLPDSPNMNLLADYFSKASYDLQYNLSQKWKGKPHQPTEPMFAKLSAPTAQPASKTLRQVWQMYETDAGKKMTPSTRKNYTVVLWASDQLFGKNKPLNEIPRESFRLLRDKLTQLPSNATKRAPGKSLEETIALAKAKKWPLVAPATINVYLAKLNALLNFAVEEQIIERNLATKLNVKDEIPDKEKREPYSLEKLRTLFTSDIWKGFRTSKPTLYWIPVIALFTGMRQNEICQLLTRDIQQADGVWVFNIEASTAPDTFKKLKTAASKRKVPIHEILIKMGFLNYHAAQNKKKNLRLFPDLEPDAKQGYHDHLFSKRYAYMTKKLVKIHSTKNTFHSFRHNMRDALEKLATPLYAIERIGGWSNSSVGSIYGAGMTPKDLKKYIDAIAYDGLDFSTEYGKSD